MFYLIIDFCFICFIWFDDSLEICWDKYCFMLVIDYLCYYVVKIGFDSWILGWMMNWWLELFIYLCVLVVRIFFWSEVVDIWFVFWIVEFLILFFVLLYFWIFFCFMYVKFFIFFIVIVCFYNFFLVFLVENLNCSDDVCVCVGFDWLKCLNYVILDFYFGCFLSCN